MSLGGYGRIQLDQVLNFGNSALNPLTLFVIGMLLFRSYVYYYFVVICMLLGLMDKLARKWVT